MSTKVRRRYLNYRVDDIFDNWIQQHTDIIKGNGIVKEIDIFRRTEIAKRLIFYLRNKGLDPFKRGIKEPERIKEALSNLTLDQLPEQKADVISFFD